MNLEYIYIAIFIIVCSWVLYRFYFNASIWQDRFSESIESRKDFLKYLVLMIVIVFVLIMGNNMIFNFRSYIDPNYRHRYNSNLLMSIILFISMFLGSILFQYGFKKMTQYFLSQTIHRSNIGSAVPGLVEIQGRIVSEHTLLTPHSKTPCVFYRSEMQEYRQSPVTGLGHSYKDYYWNTISTESHRIPFLLKDETGEIQIDPANAEFEVEKKQYGTIHTNMNYQSSTGLATVGDRKYREEFLSPNETVCVLGTLEVRKSDHYYKLIHKGRTNSSFIISHHSKKELDVALKWQMLAGLVYGSLLLIAGFIRILMITEIL